MIGFRIYFKGTTERIFQYSHIENKREQELKMILRFLAQATGRMELPIIKITLWEEQIGSLEIKSYVLAILSLR